MCVECQCHVVDLWRGCNNAVLYLGVRVGVGTRQCVQHSAVRRRASANTIRTLQAPRSVSAAGSGWRDACAIAGQCPRPQRSHLPSTLAGPLLDEREKERLAERMRYRGPAPKPSSAEMEAAARHRGVQKDAPTSRRAELEQLFDAVTREVGIRSILRV